MTLSKVTVIVDNGDKSLKYEFPKVTNFGVDITDDYYESCWEIRPWYRTGKQTVRLSLDCDTSEGTYGRVSETDSEQIKPNADMAALVKALNKAEMSASKFKVSEDGTKVELDRASARGTIRLLCCTIRTRMNWSNYAKETNP